MNIKSEPVIVSKEVAHALEAVKEDHDNDFERIITYHMETTPEWCYELEPLNEIPLDTMIRALYIGYEVEKTPEEKVKELFDSYGPNSSDEQPYGDERVQTGIILTLGKLGIIVEGINDGI